MVPGPPDDVAEWLQARDTPHGGIAGVSEKRVTYIARRLTDQVVMSGRLDLLVRLAPLPPKIRIVAVKEYLMRFRVIRHLNDLRKMASGR